MDIKNSAIALTLTFVALFSVAAQSASVVVVLDQSNENVLLPDGTDYLSVTISDGAAGAIDFQVDTLSSLKNLQDSNYGIQEFALNFGTSGATLTDLVLPAGWSAVNNGANTFSGFGSFDAILKGNGNSRQDPLLFSVTGVAGDTIQDYLNELSGGNAAEGNVLFGAHVAGFSLSGHGAGEELTSAKFGGSTVVPLPAPLALMFSALTALGFRGFQKNRKAQATA